MKTQLAYWKRQLAGAPPVLELPTDRQRPPQKTFRGSSQSLVLSEHVTRGLKALSQQEGRTLFMTLLAAFDVLLHRYTGRDDIVVGSPIANRNRAEIEGLIGFFVNTKVLRTDLSGDPSFRDLLGRVYQVATGAYANQDLPFDKLVAELAPERDLSHTPMFQVMFDLQNLPSEARNDARTWLESEASDPTPGQVEHGSSKFDLTLLMAETEVGLTASFEYSTDLFEHATVTRMLGHLQSLLGGIVADPDQSLSALPLLTDAERDQLLAEWNATETPYQADACVHGLFEAQAARTPELVAAAHEDAELDVFGVEPSVQPAGAPPPSPGSGTALDCRYLHGSLPGYVGGSSGHAQGRWGLCATGPGLPQGAAEIHDDRRSGERAAHRGALSRRTT